MAGEIIAGMGMSGIGNTASSKRSSSASNNKKTKQSNSSNKLRKKQLNYNPREISSQILRSVKSTTAGIVLVRAKMKVAVLKQCLGTGQYNDREVIAAVAHAQRMVGCAKMKLNHLKEEEKEGHSNEKEKAVNKQQKKNEIKRRISQKEQELENKIAQEKMQQIRKEKMHHQDLVRKKKMHRSKELSKIQEADMKYLKEKSESGSGDGTRTDYSGVSLELSMSAMGLQELQMSEHAIKLMEKQLEQEIAMQVEMQMEGISSVVSSGLDTGAVQDAGGGAEAAVSIDVSI